MCGKPLVNSCFGISLSRSVIAIGVIELVITVVATILNVVKFSRGWEDRYGEECDKVDVCIGPLIKYSVFDALFGVVCSIMLIVGGNSRNVCLLITWMVATFFASFKYVWVVATHNWTNLEDWISITYLLFYIVVYVVVWSLYREIKTKPVVFNPAPAQQPAGVVITQTTINPPKYQAQPQPYPQQYEQPYVQSPPPPQPHYQPYAAQPQYQNPPPYNQYN